MIDLEIAKCNKLALYILILTENIILSVSSVLFHSFLRNILTVYLYIY